MCSRVTKEVTITKDQFVIIKETVNTTEIQITDWEKIFAISLPNMGLYLGNKKNASKCRRKEQPKKREERCEISNLQKKKSKILMHKDAQTY